VQKAAWYRWGMVLWAVLLVGWFGPWGEAAAQDAPPCPVPAVYEVQAGDTLSLIAERFGTDVPTLLALNNLSDPDHIVVGQILRLPCTVQAPEQATAAVLAGIAAGQGLPQAQGEGWIAWWQAQAQARQLLRQTASSLRVQWAPIRPVPGETVTVRLWHQAPVPEVITPTVRILDTWYPMTAVQDGFIAFVPLHGFVQPGLLGITVQLEMTRGITTTVDLPVWVQDKTFPVEYIVLPPGKSGLLDPMLVRSELERLGRIWQRAEGPPMWNTAFRWPLDPNRWRTTARYGNRRSYNGGPVRSYHTGQDIAAPEGTPVRAPAPGVVLMAERLNVRGFGVVISHGAGVTSNYWHLSALAVEPGQQVKPGDIIGYVGTTGLSTGAHLHWEIRVHGVPVDPALWTRPTPLWP